MHKKFSRVSPGTLLSTPWILGFVFSLGLSGCQPTASEPEAVRSAPAIPDTTPQATVPDTELRFDADAAKQQIKASLSDEMADSMAASDGNEADPSLLPDLFKAERDTPAVRLNGKLLTNEGAETLSDSVDGVEVKLEVRTQ